MASSTNYDFYRRPNFSTAGAVPKYLRLPTWLPDSPPVFPRLPAPWSAPPSVSPAGPSPFPDWPPKSQEVQPPHEVDPPEKNPYNDPEPNPRNNPAWDPNFLVTENLSGRNGVDPVGGLLGLLQAVVPSQSEANVGTDLNLKEVPQQRIAVPTIPSQAVRILVGRRSGQ